MSSSLDEDRGPSLRALTISLMVLPTVVVILRFWSRALLSGQSKLQGGRRFWWDDWTALGAAILSLAVCGLGLHLIDLGLGKHAATIPAEQQFEFLKFIWIEYYVFDTGTSLAKSSALFFYARIFRNAKTNFKYALWVMQAAVYIWLLGILISVVFSCVPVQKSWMPMIDGHCSNEDTLWLGSVIPSVIIDLIILIMPLPMIWKLQMKLTKKILIMGVFMCGYLVIVVSLGRLITIIQAGPGLQEDVTWNTVTPIFWLACEVPISVISVSLPSIFFLVRRGYREGLSSLIRTHPRGSRARLHDLSPQDTEASSQRLQDVPIELGMHSSDSTRKMAFLGSEQNYHAEASKGSSYHESLIEESGKSSGSGIHVKNEVEIRR